MRRTKQRAKKQERAFTMLEVVGAGFVLSVTILGLSATMATGYRLTENSREEVQVRYAIRTILADLTAADFDVLKSTYEKKGFAIEGMRPVKGDADGLPGEIEFTAPPEDAPGMHRVTIRVRWHGRSGERTLESVHYLANVAVILEDVPNEAVLLGYDPPASPLDLLGYFSGTSLMERSTENPWSSLPAVIVIFRRNLERHAGSREALVEQLRITLFHEIGHFLGLDEDDLALRGLE